MPSLVLVMMLISSIGQAGALRPGFTVYGFIPYKAYVDGDTVRTGLMPDEYLAKLGIHKVNLVYERRLLEDGNDHGAGAVVDREKMRSIAEPASLQPDVLVALDIETWPRNDGINTPKKYINAIRLFRSFNPASSVGLYATVPQVTYGDPGPKRAAYDELNSKYAAVAKLVDYFSPSLYNYTGHDTDAWDRSAEYAFAAARRYDAGKPIIPYVTPEISPGRSTTWLSYDEMMHRLTMLKRLGAKGCIIWTSSGSTDSSGANAQFNPKEGWAKAVIDFEKSNSQ